MSYRCVSGLSNRLQLNDLNIFVYKYIVYYCSIIITQTIAKKNNKQTNKFESAIYYTTRNIFFHCSVNLAYAIVFVTPVETKLSLFMITHNTYIYIRYPYNYCIYVLFYNSFKAHIKS